MVIFSAFLIFDQNFFSQQMKQSVIINNKYGINNFPRTFSNDSPRILGI